MASLWSGGSEERGSGVEEVVEVGEFAFSHDGVSESDRIGSGGRICLAGDADGAGEDDDDGGMMCASEVSSPECRKLDRFGAVEFSVCNRVDGEAT